MDDIGYFNPNIPNSVAEMLGQANFGSNNFSNQKSGISLNNRPMNSNPPNQFSRSMSVTGHTTPTSMTSQSQNQNRGVLAFGKGSLGANMPMSSQVGNNMLSGMSPTRGGSPSDIFGLHSKQTLGRNQSFNMNSQSLGMSAIGSESSLNALRQHSIPSSGGLLEYNDFPPLKVGSSANQNGITNLFNLDQAEFPALNHRTRPIGSQPINSKPSSYGYESILSKPSESSEFQIHNEDFPALPGTQGALNVMKTSFPEQDGRGDESSSRFPFGNLQTSSTDGEFMFGTKFNIDAYSIDKGKSGGSSSPKGIQVLADNTIRNIPSTMLTDQYGIVGLLAFIKAAETNQTLVHLALGNDLTTLGLNLNSPDNLYHKFQSPFSRQPCRPQDIDFFVPSEYLTNAHIRDKLAPIKLNRYGEDLLFYVYYTNPGDILQLAAAAELYNRDWRYHKEEKIWITRAPGIEPRVKSNTYEQGTYYYFDCQNWRKVPKEFILEYEKLEDRPHLPNLMALHFNPAQNA